MGAKDDDRPGALVIDFAPAVEFLEALEELERKWAAVPEVARPGLSRMIWLHPNGEAIVYTTPDSEPTD